MAFDLGFSRTGNVDCIILLLHTYFSANI